MTNLQPLPAAFDLKPRGELIALVGGGGKTSLMFALANALPGRRIISTTTRIFAAQMKLAPEVVVFTAKSAEDAERKMSDALDRREICLVVGAVEGEKAMGVSPSLPGQWLARPDVDFVLVEADGSRMRPIKAPAAHEPVIPPDATLVIPVVGIDALDGRFPEVTHRPEVAAKLLKWSVIGEQLSVGDVARLIVHQQGGLKGVPEGARVIPFINKVETAVQLTAARQIAQQMLQEPRIDRVVIGAVKTSQPIREVQTRITAVVLAAGQAKRMGQTKQLLPWGKTTVLGQTIHNLKQTAVHNICLVSGHEADKIEVLAAAEGIYTIRNAQYASTEMITSLQTAVRQLPPHVTAVLVILADQPMVQPAIIDQILAAYWQGQSDLIAPVYEGQRGNPVLIGRAYFKELLNLSPNDAPRTLLHRHPDKLYLLPVESDTILRDLDNPEQYEQERPFPIVSKRIGS